MVGVPVLLIIDFGSSFLVFIRGGSANQMFLPELIYDYIKYENMYYEPIVDHSIASKHAIKEFKNHL